MRAAVFLGEGRVEIQDVPEPQVERPDTVVLQVAANALCGTDLHAIEVPPTVWFRPGVILGHEFAGVVVAAGSESGFTSGDRVAVLPNITCGKCEMCRRGIPNMCSSQMGFGSDLINGAAAQYVSAPASVVHRVPERLSLELAAIAEPLACVLNGVLRAGWRPGSKVVILGGGPIGLMYYLSARAFGVRDVTIVEATPGRRAMAARLGANVVDPTDESAMRELRECEADVVVDTVGTLVGDAIAIARRRGLVLLFGLNDRVEPAFPTALAIRKEIRIEGVFLASNTFPLALELLSDAENRFDELITHRFGLDRFDDAVAALRDGTAVKALILPNT